MDNLQTKMRIVKSAFKDREVIQQVLPAQELDADCFIQKFVERQKRRKKKMTAGNHKIGSDGKKRREVLEASGGNKLTSPLHHTMASDVSSSSKRKKRRNESVEIGESVEARYFIGRERLYDNDDSYDRSVEVKKQKLLERKRQLEAELQRIEMEESGINRTPRGSSKKTPLSRASNFLRQILENYSNSDDEPSIQTERNTDNSTAESSNRDQAIAEQKTEANNIPTALLDILPDLAFLNEIEEAETIQDVPNATKSEDDEDDESSPSSHYEESTEITEMRVTNNNKRKKLRKKLKRSESNVTKEIYSKKSLYAPFSPRDNAVEYEIFRGKIEAADYLYLASEPKTQAWEEKPERSGTVSTDHGVNSQATVEDLQSLELSGSESTEEASLQPKFERLSPNRHQQDTPAIILNEHEISDDSFEDGVVDVATEKTPQGSYTYNKLTEEIIQEQENKDAIIHRRLHKLQLEKEVPISTEREAKQPTRVYCDESEEEEDQSNVNEPENLLEFLKKNQDSPQVSDSPPATYRTSQPLSPYQLQKLQQIHTQQQYKERTADYAMEKAFEGLQHSVHRADGTDVVQDYLEPKRKVMYDMLKRGYGSRALGISVSDESSELNRSSEREEVRKMNESVSSPPKTSSDHTYTKPYISKLSDNTQALLNKKNKQPVRNLDEIIHRLTSPLPKEKTFRKSNIKSSVTQDPRPQLSPGTRALYSDNSGVKDFHTRQDAFLLQKQSKIEARRSQEESEKKVETFQPQINKTSKTIKRSVDSLYSWHNEALAKRMRRKEVEEEVGMKPYTFKPQLSSRTEKIMQRKKKGTTTSNEITNSPLIYRL